MICAVLRLAASTLAVCVTLAAQTFPLVEVKAGAIGFYSLAGERLAGVRIGEYPYEIALAPDGRTAYISDNDILWMPHAGEGGNTISIVGREEPDEARRDRSRQKSAFARPGARRQAQSIAHPTENPNGLLLMDLNTRQVVRQYDVQGKIPTW